MKKAKRKRQTAAKKRSVATPKRPAPPRKRRKTKMSGKKPIEEEEPRSGAPKKPKTAEVDPMGQPPDSPPNPNLPPDESADKPGK